MILIYTMPNFRQRKWLFIAIAIAVIIVITLVVAPNSGSSQNANGSTYSKSPDGYGAWYEYMRKKDVAINRWRKPFAKLVEAETNNITYVRVLSHRLLRRASRRLASPKDGLGECPAKTEPAVTVGQAIFTFL